LKKVTTIITSNTEVMAGVHLIWLEAPDIASTARPGQFVMVRCGEESLLRRPLSIHQVDGKDKLAILFNVVGKGTEWLAQCKVGDSLDILGSLGNSFSINPASKNLLLVAGGIGIAPLCFLAQESLTKEHRVTLLYGTANVNRYPLHLLPPDLELVSSTEDGSLGNEGRVTDLLPDFIDRADQIFACGPLPMYKAMAQMPELKNKPVQISLEVRMGCGLGICYGCTVKTKQGLKQVCRDGPVFELDDILWDELNW